MVELFFKILKRTYKFWSCILPSFYYAYKLPTGGRVFIDITESPMMFDRIIGKFEPELHKAIDYFLSEGDSFIDIGANKGDFAIHAALTVGSKGRVVAFEPAPENCKWIRQSIIKSKLYNILIEEAAIGAAEKKLNLYLGEKSGWHSLVTSGQNLQNRTLNVNVYSLDSYLEKNPLNNLKAIKIDVEGFEKEVLLGAHKTLYSLNNIVIFVEIHTTQGVKYSDIYDILKSYGFSLYECAYPFNKQLKKKQEAKEIIAVKNLKTLV